jgi:hypothetical protein
MPVVLIIDELKALFASFVASLLDGFRREELKGVEEYGILTHPRR